MWITIVLPIAALLAATLSGMIGMGGGMLLLAVMFSFLPHSEAIPAHGAVQFVSNSTRTLAFLRHVDWRTIGRFSVGVVPGSVLGVLVLWSLGPSGESEPYLKMLVGAYILTSLVIPRPRQDAPPRNTWWDFPLLGLIAGAAAFTVGAIGPLIAPLFARREFVKERLIATKAVCQSLLHLAKIPTFLLLRDYANLSQLGLVTGLMIVAVIPGTLLGKRLLKDLSENAFVVLFRVALLVAGVKVLVVDGLLALLRTGT
jgi:uncharacterized membrane protein YfcA